MPIFTQERSAGFETYPMKSNTTIDGGTIVVVDTATGFAEEGKTGTGLVVVGKAYETKTNSGADGALGIQVKPSHGEIVTDYLLLNDSGPGSTPLGVTDLEKPCFLKNKNTVTGDNTGRSEAGIVKGFEGANRERVWVQLIR